MASLLGEIQAFPGAPPPWLSMALSQHSQPMLGSQVPGVAGSCPSLAQGTADDPCDTSVTPTSALFQAGDVSAGSCTWLRMTAGNVASPWRSFALLRCFAGNKGQDGVSVGAQNSEFFRGGQLNGLNLPFPGITPVGVSELHQGQVTPGCLPVVLHPSAGWEGDAAVGF